MITTYSAFPKIEKQGGTEEIFRDYANNRTYISKTSAKNRQICGPHDTKKIANAFISFMEKNTEAALSEAFSDWIYCGSKNWDDLGEVLTKMNDSFHRPIWGAADGSGFDMTQHYVTINYFNDIVIQLL